ncbi:MAG: thioredoxin-disulfide reductase [Chlamydiales bacterium]|nr:thioredoxin-disulfide reductase [Chlamydiales bacterium]
MQQKKVVIIGSGPAGHTAALYAARANLEPLMFEGFYAGLAGGQLMTTTEVENYPGFPSGITGPDLMIAMRSQSVKFGTKILKEDVKEVDLSQELFRIKGTKTEVYTHALIIATGATAKRLDIEGTRDGEFWQKGVTACAVCDGAMPIFRNKELYVVGGGDTAMEEALFLTKFGSMVYIVHRRDEFRASKIMAARVLKHPKIKVVWNHVVAKVEGNQVVESVTIEDVNTKKREQRSAAGLFFAIGHEPNTGFLKGQIKLTDHGYIVIDPATSHTSKEGVFAAGDVHDARYKQAVTAAGAGCKAALDAEKYLAEKGFLD